MIYAGIPSPAQGVWFLGPVPIRAYALAILTGILIAAFITIRRYRGRGGPEGAVLDMVIVAVPCGIVGARIYHVLTHADTYFAPGADLLEIFAIWRGGLAIIGGVIGGFLGAWAVLRRKGLRLAPMADSIAPALLVAQAIGRLGNYFNQELFGGPTDLPWGLQIDDRILQAHGLDPGILVHPTFGYELIWNLAMAAVLVILDRRLRLGHGRVFCLYVMAYGTGRFFIEMLRTDPAQEFAGLRLNSWAALLLVVLALVALIVIGRRHPGRDESVWLPGREPDEASDEDHEADLQAAEEQDAGVEIRASTIEPDDLDDDSTSRKYRNTAGPTTSHTNTE